MFIKFLFNQVKCLQALSRSLLCLLALCSMLFVGSVSAADKIIVSGASGQLGSLVVKELLARGVAPTDLILISRSVEKLDDYAKMGAAVRFGDFTKPESLAAAYVGGDRMLLISIGGENRPTYHKAAMDAAKAAGVKQIAYTSFVNMENNTSALANDHRQSEKFLKESGVAWTMLRNQIYMETVLTQAAEIAAAGEVMVLPVEDKIAYVTRADCAAAAAAVLTTPGHDNKAYNITGPSPVGSSDVGKAVALATGKTIDINVDTNANPGFAAMVGGSAVLLSTNTVEVLTGRPATSIEQFIAANKSSL